jgi:hypothetical protein
MGLHQPLLDYTRDLAVYNGEAVASWSTSFGAHSMAVSCRTHRHLPLAWRFGQP